MFFIFISISLLNVTRNKEFSVSGATGAVTITNSGVTSAVAGTGVGVSAATGADVQIDRDTPWSCNPASETYWSM